MPMMFRFAEQRRKLLEEEFLRIAGEMRSLGAVRFWAAGDLAADRVGPESDLDIVVVHETEAPFRYRSDFFTTHLRPTVGVRFTVYTPREVEELAETDLFLRHSLRLSRPVEV